MANRFWVAGGTGNWSSTSNWSTTTGGSSGAAVPTSADDVFVNALSGTSPTITVDATSNCLSLDFTGAITPTLAGSSNINAFGSVTYISTMTLTHSGSLGFSATTTGKTFTSAGKSIIGQINFNGVGGGWTLQDGLTALNTINLNNGTLNTNGMSVNGVSISSAITNIRTLTLGASVITLTGSWSFSTTTNLTFNANTSTIIMAGNTRTFDGGGLTYNNLTIAGTPTTMNGSNTFNTITLSASKTLKLTSGTTQIITSLVSNGTTANKSVLNSVTSGSAASISKSSGVVAVRNISLKDITATGGAAFYAMSSTDTSGNTGWAYQMLIKQEKLSGTEMALYHIDSNGAMQKVSG